MILHGYWRSTASYRVRIALALKGLTYEQVHHDLRTGAQAALDYAALNPQHLVPTLEADGVVLTQSLAIIEWIDERHPSPPLLPADANGRAVVRAMATIIGADIHPLHNLRVLNRLRSAFGADDAAVNAWIADWMTAGFAALEPLVARHGRGFVFGDTPTLADCFLVPQLYAAARFGVDMAAYPKLAAAGAQAAALPAFATAHPAAQPDAD